MTWGGGFHFSEPLPLAEGARQVRGGALPAPQPSPPRGDGPHFLPPNPAPPRGDRPRAPFPDPQPSRDRPRPRSLPPNPATQPLPWVGAGPLQRGQAPPPFPAPQLSPCPGWELAPHREDRPCPIPCPGWEPAPHRGDRPCPPSAPLSLSPRRHRPGDGDPEAADRAVAAEEAGRRVLPGGELAGPGAHPVPGALETRAATGCLLRGLPAIPGNPPPKLGIPPLHPQIWGGGWQGDSSPIHTPVRGDPSTQVSHLCQ